MIDQKKKNQRNITKQTKNSNPKKAVFCIAWLAFFLQTVKLDYYHKTFNSFIVYLLVKIKVTMIDEVNAAEQ